MIRRRRPEEESRRQRRLGWITACHQAISARLLNHWFPTESSLNFLLLLHQTFFGDRVQPDSAVVLSTRVRSSLRASRRSYLVVFGVRDFPPPSPIDFWQ